MPQPITVRFSEHQSYDIVRDCFMVRMMATTAQGTYYADTPLEGAKSLRERRSEFKDAVVDMIQQDKPPCELLFDDEPQETMH